MGLAIYCIFYLLCIRIASKLNMFDYVHYLPTHQDHGLLYNYALHPELFTCC
jgi:hypothetical protein